MLYTLYAVVVNVLIITVHGLHLEWHIRSSKYHWAMRFPVVYRWGFSIVVTTVYIIYIYMWIHVHVELILNVHVHVYMLM